jgi:hypothetical protein
MHIYVHYLHFLKFGVDLRFLYSVFIFAFRARCMCCFEAMYKPEYYV